MKIVPKMFHSASLIKNDHDEQQLFALTESGYKHIDDHSLQVKRSISGMLNQSKLKGRLNNASPKLNISIRNCTKIACHSKNCADLQISQSCTMLSLCKIAIFWWDYPVTYTVHHTTETFTYIQHLTVEDMTLLSKEFSAYQWSQENVTPLLTV